MIGFIIAFFLAHPRRVVTVGRAGFSLVGFVIVCGLIGRVALVGIPSIRSMGGPLAESVTLASLYPALPTWWIPESPVGYAFVTLLSVSFIALTLTGRKLERLIDSETA